MCLLNTFQKSCILKEKEGEKTSPVPIGLFVDVSLCLFIYLSCLLSCHMHGRGSEGPQVLGWIRWTSAIYHSYAGDGRPGRNMARVNTNHRSFRDTDTHRQTQINTHIYIKYVFEDRCFNAYTEPDTGHITTCLLQHASFSSRLFLPLHLCLSFGTLVSLLSFFSLSFLLAE